MNTYPEFDSTGFDTNDFVSNMEQYEDTDAVVLALGLDGLVDNEKEVVEPTNVEPTNVVVLEVIEPQKEWKEPSKMEQCRVIFAAHFGKPNVTRKLIISLFMSQAGCTPKGAATYYQTLTKLVKEAA